MNSSHLQVHPFPWNAAEMLADGLGLPLTVGIVLARRGFTAVEEAGAFLNPPHTVADPFLMRDMGRAVSLLEDALAEGRRIVVYGDYDVDGIAATALVCRTLRDLGGRVETYLPSRFEEGYGLSEEAVEAIARQGDGLLLTVDCGVTGIEEVAKAGSLGLDVIVSDHHRCGEGLPACPVIHPEVGEYPEENLCGTGVAFKLMHGLFVGRGEARDSVPQALAENLDLVALATVADIVPLLGENRYYVREGLKRIGWGKKAGLRALARSAALDGAPDARAIAFRLAPRLNAAGRMGDAQIALDLLLTEDEEEASRLSSELEDINGERRAVGDRILLEAKGQVESLPALPSALVLWSEDWHRGVLGIVASRLVDDYGRPTILLACENGWARGSGRSIPVYDLFDGISSCGEKLERFGGHAQAAGLSLRTDALPDFARALDRHAVENLRGVDLTPSYRVDALVRGEDLTLETIDALEKMAPFGEGNEPIRLLATGARLDQVGGTRRGDHLRATLVVDGIRSRAVGFGLGGKVEELSGVDQGLHVGFSFEADEWQGETRAQAKIDALFAQEDRGEESLGCSPGCPHLDPLHVSEVCADCIGPYEDVIETEALRGRDMRDKGGVLSIIGQVVSSGGSTVVVGISAGEWMRAVAGRLPLRELGVRRVECMSRLCWRGRTALGSTSSLLFMDWTAAARRASLLQDREQVIVVDPPYLPGHTGLLKDLGSGGARVHFCYGNRERERTAAELRVILHPRYWMVALYRAVRMGLEGGEAREAARLQAWESHGRLPSVRELEVAEKVLEEVGGSRSAGEEAKMDLETSVTYVEATKAFEEATRLCRSM